LKCEVKKGKGKESKARTERGGATGRGQTRWTTKRSFKKIEITTEVQSGGV